MLRNYLNIAIRNLLKNKTFSLINILGLAFGLTCALLISLWVMDEYAIDNYHTNKSRTYQVISELKSSGGSQYWLSSPIPLAEVMNKDIAGVESAIRMTRNRLLLFMSDRGNLEEGGINADPDFLKMFDYPLQAGDPETALNEPRNIILSKKLAESLFSSTDIVGNTVTIKDWGKKSDYKVTGVLDDIPSTSTMGFEYIRPYESYVEMREWNNVWGNYNDRIMVMLDENNDPRAVEQLIDEFSTKRAPDYTTDFHLYPHSDIYLKANFKNGLDAEGKIVYVRVFIVIALIIVVIACINFMNLSTARAGKRAKEVGVRKATGADRKEIIWQFLGESILIALISGIVAITLSDLLMPGFNFLVEKTLSVPYSNITFMLSVLGVCLLTGLLAGAYPAFYLSGFNPSVVLKTAVSTGKSLSGIRRILVVIQFSLSIMFVITTAIVYQQLDYILSKDLGLDKVNVLHHDLNGIMNNKVEAYNNEIRNIPGVINATASNFSPLAIFNSTSNVDWNGKSEEDDDVFFHVMQTDNFFLLTFGLDLIDGKNFSDKYDTARLEVIVNEEALKTMWMEAGAAGQKIHVWGDEVTIVGVVKNFHHQNLEHAIDPVVIYFSPKQAWRNFIAIKGDITQARQEIKKVYDNYENEYPFDYGFVDQDFEENYARINNMGQLSIVFAIAAIIVSCLGLFGLASYMIEQRKKETGIRKALGASVATLVFMFSKKFMSLILVSALISFPLSWYITNEWLSGFAYHIDQPILPFLAGGISAMVIALGTVSYHTMKAALANPIDSLKYE